jgi:hypothetical protein
MHRAAALPPGQKTLCGANVDKTADRLGGLKARQRSVLADAPETKNLPQHRSGRRRVVDHQRDTVETADRVFGWNA